MNRRRKVCAPGEPAGGDRSAVSRLPDHRGKSGAPDGVHSRCPALLVEGAGGRFCQLGTRHENARPEPPQVSLLLGSPAHRRHAVAEAGEHRHRHAPDASRCAGDDDG